MPVDDINEHDNAVKGLLDVKFWLFCFVHNYSSEVEFICTAVASEIIFYKLS